MLPKNSVTFGEPSLQLTSSYGRDDIDPTVSDKHRRIVTGLEWVSKNLSVLS